MNPAWTRRVLRWLWCLVPAAAGAHAGDLFLVVGASAASPQAIARQAAALDVRGTGLVLNTADCGERRPLFAWAARVTADQDVARQALADLRASVPDAFIKTCRPRAGSLLSLQLPAVHPSIAGVADNAVNWTDADRISSAVPLVGGASAVLQRYRDPAADDPLEGRRVRVLLARPGEAPKELLASCHGAAVATDRRRWLVLSCEGEQAGDHLLHVLHAYAISGQAAGQVQRCRNPQFGAVDTLRCQQESVDAQGRLRLQARESKLPLP